MKPAAIITGASRGLGLSLAEKLLKEGYRVFGLSRTKTHWKQALQRLGPSSEAVFLQADLTSEANVKKVLQKILKVAGRVDLVVNNAGIGGGLQRLEETSAGDLTAMMEANLYASFYVCKHVLPVLRRQGEGLIVNISSMAGQRAVPKLFAYSASKFGILSLTQCLAKENSDRNVRAITVCPGGMNTKMRSDLFGEKDASAQQSPDFVADVVLKIIRGEIQVESGGDIVIRHGEITAIHPCPGR